MTEEDYYQHHGYWERVADNVARWLGLPHVTALDVVILLPLFPLLVLGIIRRRSEGDPRSRESVASIGVLILPWAELPRDRVIRSAVVGQLLSVTALTEHP